METCTSASKQTLNNVIATGQSGRRTTKYDLTIPEAIGPSRMHGGYLRRGINDQPEEDIVASVLMRYTTDLCGAEQAVVVARSGNGDRHVST